MECSDLLSDSNLPCANIYTEKTMHISDGWVYLDYEKYVASRKVKNAKTKQVTSIEEDLVNLKNEMNEIKSLLKELVNGN